MPIPVILAGAVAKVALGPVVKAAVAKAVTKVADSPYIPEVNKADAAPVASAVIEALGQDPQFVNASNSEPFYQSGIAWGAGVTALGVLVPMVAGLFGFDVSTERVVEVGGSIVTIVGILYTLYRRFTPGLKPLFSRKA